MPEAPDSGAAQLLSARRGRSALIWYSRGPGASVTRAGSLRLAAPSSRPLNGRDQPNAGAAFTGHSSWLVLLGGEPAPVGVLSRHWPRVQGSPVILAGASGYWRYASGSGPTLLEDAARPTVRGAVARLNPRLPQLMSWLVRSTRNKAVMQ